MVDIQPQWIGRPGEYFPTPFWLLQAPADRARPERATFWLVEFVAGVNGAPVLSGRGRMVGPPHHLQLAELLGLRSSAGRGGARREAGAFLIDADGFKLADRRVIYTIGHGHVCQGCKERVERALARVRAMEANA
jgi:hypothetical protein